MYEEIPRTSKRNGRLFRRFDDINVLYIVNFYTAIYSKLLTVLSFVTAVILLVHFFEVEICHVGIDLRCCDILVSQHLLDLS